MKHFLRVIVAGIGWASLAAHGQGAFYRLVTFDGPPYIDPTHSKYVNYYSENAMTFRPADPDSLFGR